MYDKPSLFAAWRERLHATRAGLASAADAARDGTRVDGAHRPENRGERAAVTSQGYLSAGLAQRMAEVDAALELLGRVEPSARARVVTGAVFEVETADGEVLRYAVLPGGDGAVLGELRVISPDAPLAAALWGLREGDEATLVTGGRELVVVVIEVA